MVPVPAHGCLAVVRDVPLRTIAVHVGGLSTGVSLCLNFATEGVPVVHWATDEPVFLLHFCAGPTRERSRVITMCVSRVIPYASCARVQYLSVRVWARARALCRPSFPDCLGGTRPDQTCHCILEVCGFSRGPGPWGL